MRRLVSRIGMAMVLGFVLGGRAEGATITAASCSAADVQAAINSAASGDTVRVPNPPCTVNGSLSIPSSKGITLDGSGSTLTGDLNVTANATASTRVTGWTFTKSVSGYTGFVTFGGGLNSAIWRLDSCSFPGNGSGTGPLIDVSISRGVIDHCTFSGLNAAQEYIHVTGYGAGSTSGWTNALTPGSPDALYLEDNTFTQAVGQANCSWIQSYYGARTVMRYNTFNFSCVDQHGTAGMVAARWWEGYKNTFVRNSGDNQSWAFSMRGGSGIIFGNTKSGSGGNIGVGLCEEDTGYPASYQIGRGQNQTLVPAYVWGNGSISTSLNECDAPEQAGMVQANRDVYLDAGASCPAGGNCTSGIGSGTTLPTSCTTNTAFWKTDAGGDWDTTHGGANDGALYKCTSLNSWTLYYTPYTYPHPMVSGAGLPPRPPTNVRVVP